jgi:hypothetical protein
VVKHDNALMDREESILSTLGESEVHIFAHDIATAFRRAELEAHIPGYRFYGQRALLFARPDDIVCVSEPVDRHYLKYLSELGIGPSADRLIEFSKDLEAENQTLRVTGALARLCKAIAKSRDFVLNPYQASPSEFAFARALAERMDRPVRTLGGNADIVARANCKHLVYAEALQRRLPMAPGEVVELMASRSNGPLTIDPLLYAIVRSLDHTRRVIVRGTDGGGGRATFITGPMSVEELERKVKTFVEKQVHHVYLVQAMFDILVTPNILVHVPPDGRPTQCVGVTDQRLDDRLAHKGNLFPSKAGQLDGMLHSAHRLAGWLQQEGYSGLAGFDFVEYRDPMTGERRQIFVEINARINAAAYPLCLLSRLRMSADLPPEYRPAAFLSAVISTKARTFSQLRDRYGPLFYDPRKGRGLIPYNTGRLAHSLCEMVFLGRSREEAEELFDLFQRHEASPPQPTPSPVAIAHPPLS